MRIPSRILVYAAGALTAGVVFLLITCTKNADLFTPDNFGGLRGSISGNVVDKRNNVMPGVSVTAYPAGTTTLTGADGSFTLNDLPEGKQVLAFRCADYVDTTTDSITLTLLESKQLNAPVHMKYRYAWLRGTVTCGACAASGMVNAGVQIENQVVSTHTLPTGTFLLPSVLPGVCKVFAAVNGVGYGMVEKNIPADDTTDLTLAITNAGGTVQGQVTDAASNPVVGAVVSTMGGVIADTTNTQGNYRLTQVPGDGRMTLTISKGGDTVLLQGAQVADSQSITLATAKLVSGSTGKLRIFPMSIQTVAGSPTSIAVSATRSDSSVRIAWYDWDENGDGIFDRRTPVPVDTGLVFTVGSHTVKVRVVGSDTTVVSETVDISVTAVVPTYALIAAVNSAVMGTVSPTSGNYAAGAEILLTKTPDSGYVFDHWGGADSLSMHSDTLYMPGHNAAVTAVFKAIIFTFTVTYYGNGNTSGIVPTDSATYISGQSVKVKANTGSLVKTSYTFAGWNTKSDGSGTSYAVAATFTMGTANDTLYAKWTQSPTYAVIYNGNGNTGGTAPVDSNAYSQGTTVTVKGNTGALVKTSYTFAGWNTKSDGSGTSYAAAATFAMGAANDTLYAKWTQSPTYAVIYNGNGNTGGTVPVDSNAYLQGATATAKANTGALARTGFTFAGWNTQANDSGISYAAGATFSMGSGNVNLYAQWSIVPTYTLTATVNSALMGTVSPTSGNYTAGAKIPLTKTADSGYVFDHWSGADSLSMHSDTLYMPGHNASVAAVFKAVVPTFTVTYYGNTNTSGTVPTDNNNYATGATVTVLNNSGALAKAGSTFAGWNTLANGSGTSYAAGSTFPMGPSNVTLYAQWTANPTYTVTYNGNGYTSGVVPTDSNAYSSGATVIVLGNIGGLGKNGYTFAGWNTQANDSGISYLGGANFSMGSANVKLYAQWTIIPNYTLTATVNSALMGSVSPTSGNYSAGQKIALTKTANSGYAFGHWGGADSASMHSDTLYMPAHNAVVMADFTAVTYQLSVFAGIGGIITAPSPSVGTVNYGANTAIKASPKVADSTFAYWTVTVGTAIIADSTADSTTVSLTSGNATIMANFKPTFLWTAANSGIASTSIKSLDVIGNNIFTGTPGGGVYLSSNSGGTWTSANSGLPMDSINSFVETSYMLFVGTSGGGVFISFSNGASWAAVDSGLTNLQVSALAVSAGDSNLFAGTGGGVFLFDTNSASWSAVNTGLTNTHVTCLCVSGSNVFAGTAGGGVFLSSNKGTNWSAVNNGLTNVNVTCLAVSGGTIYAGTQTGGVFYSADNGSTWNVINNGLTNTNVTCLCVSGSNVFAGTSGGVFLSFNNGTNWTAANSGLPYVGASSFAVKGTTIFAGTFSSGVFSSPLP
jgi:uncharacterized repeat protein (TIGR02543 family)